MKQLAHIAGSRGVSTVRPAQAGSLQTPPYPPHRFPLPCRLPGILRDSSLACQSVGTVLFPLSPGRAAFDFFQRSFSSKQRKNETNFP